MSLSNANPPRLFAMSTPTVSTTHPTFSEDVASEDESPFDEPPPNPSEWSQSCEPRVVLRSCSTLALNSASDSKVAIIRSGSHTHRPPSDSASAATEPATAGESSSSSKPATGSPPICSSSAQDTHGSQNRLNHLAASAGEASACGESFAVAAAMVAGETPQSRCRILDSMRGCDSHPPPWETSGRCEKSTSSSMPRWIGWSVVRRPPPRDGSRWRWSRIISTPRSAAAPTVSEFIESIARARVAALAASASLPKRCSRTPPWISSKRDPPPKRAPGVAKSSKR
mmetsp:Transcript_1179/g.4806  ORF Transcript_1179/g.4806 Transcript_1179/m.4806 type:complete len:284 (+) Transcript_1179:1176-2027(+)